MQTIQTGSGKRQSIHLGASHKTSTSGKNIATAPSIAYGEVELWRGSRQAEVRPKMKFYALDRVVIAKSSTSVLNRPVRINGAMNKAVETKRSKLQAIVNSILIEINVMSTEVLTRLACESYNDMWAERNGFSRKEWKRANAAGSPLFIGRISVNYLRHEITPYEGTLMSLFKMVGVREGSTLIKERVLDRIAEAYPHLENECSRQKHSIKTRGQEKHRLGRTYWNKTISENRSWG